MPRFDMPEIMARVILVLKARGEEKWAKLLESSACTTQGTPEELEQTGLALQRILDSGVARNHGVQSDCGNMALFIRSYLRQWQQATATGNHAKLEEWVEAWAPPTDQ